MITCRPVAWLLLAPLVCALDRITNTNGAPQSGAVSIIENPLSLSGNNHMVLLVWFFDSLYTKQTFLNRQKRQKYMIRETAIQWDSNPDVWPWCEDIFYSPTGDVQYDLKAKVFKIGLDYRRVLLDTSPGGINWRTIRKCTNPDCLGCFRPLRQFLYTLSLSDDESTLAFGRCQGYEQYACDVDDTCTNGQSVSNFKSVDWYSNLHILTAKCKDCSPGTWNTCTVAVGPLPLKTCSWYRLIFSCHHRSMA